MEDFDNQSTQSVALVGSNKDLLTKILLRLPVTSILRFKSVSKHLRWLLSHKSFTRRYDNNNLSKSLGLFSRYIYIYIFLCFRLDRGVRILQSCNGLLLCCTSWWNEGSRKYYVLNPTTNQVAAIPSVIGDQKSICFMALAFHQTKCVRYKLVCIYALKQNVERFQIQIYSSKRRKWKISIYSFSPHKPTFGIESFTFDKGAYWNAAIHWAPCYKNSMYFNIKVEKLKTLPLPVEMMSSETKTMYFGESIGHLHLIVKNKPGDNINNSFLNVYEMLTDHSGWFVKYQLQLDEPRAFPCMITQTGYNFEVIDVVRGEKEEDTFLVVLVPGKMITYNVHDMSFTETYSRVGYNFDEFLNVHRYIETLTSYTY
ncbi:F-box protein At5g07610-like [Bidens hawaiensis]|uniref:F-box protein At5g07610-like n=1 Tax=Bidens hawaiensis TaxID=980011 RepID=UPI00404B7122